MRKILVISLSNIGDVILACPALDVLLATYPEARLTVVLSQRTETLFKGHPRIEVVVYDKHWPIGQQWRWILQMRRVNYDILVDLRNTFFSLLLKAKKRSWPPLWRYRGQHLTQKHLTRLNEVVEVKNEEYPRAALMLSAQHHEKAAQWVGPSFAARDFGVIVPQAADSQKTWPESSFTQLLKNLPNETIVMLGSKEQYDLIERMSQMSGKAVINLAGKTNLIDAAALVKQAKWVIVHDSGMMHLASYFNAPVLALFGPTNPLESGPWSTRSQYIIHNAQCQRCQHRHLVDVPHTCMAAITVDEVVDQLKVLTS